MRETIVAAGTVLLGPATNVLRDGAVLVRDGRIAAVDTTETIRRAHPDADLTQFPTGTLLPGLINAHVRLVLSGSSNPTRTFQETDPADLPEQMRRHHREVWSAGVTTVRDMGDTGGLAIQLGKDGEAGRVAGPRIVAAGPPLTVPGGDGGFLGGVVDSDDAIRAAIADRAEAGAALICYHGSGGYLTPGGPTFWDAPFPDAQAALIVSEAARYGLPVAAHVYSASGISQAVDAGVHSIEHCLWSTGDGQWRRDEAVARRMAEQGIYVCIPSGRNRAAIIARHGEQRAIELFYSRYPWFDQIGVRLIPGTTAGSTNAVFSDFVTGLETYEWMGFGLDRIIDIATVDAAEALGLAGVTGALATGYSADLLVVEGNPLDDLQSLRRPQLVMAAGQRTDQ